MSGFRTLTPCVKSSFLLEISYRRVGDIQMRLRIVDGHEPKEDLKWNQQIEKDEILIAQHYQFEHMSPKQKQKAIEGRDVSEYAEDLCYAVGSFYQKYGRR